MIRGVSPRSTIEVEVDSPSGEDRLRGAFTWRRRTVADNGAISAEMSRLTGGVNIVDDEMRTMITMQAELATVTEKAPEWWRADQIDNATLVAVYRRYMEWRDSFRRRKEAGADGVAESSALGPGPSEPRRGLAAALVGAQVPPPG